MEKKNTKTIEKVTKRHNAVNSYTYNGIEVWVQIDYTKQEISLINSLPHGMNRVEKKNWIFAERGLLYTTSWLNIMDAMKYAVSRASEELAEYVLTLKKQYEL